LQSIVSATKVVDVDAVRHLPGLERVNKAALEKGRSVGVRARSISVT
jgi:hypothetical protein